MKKVLSMLLVALVALSVNTVVVRAEDKLNITWVPSWGSGSATQSSQDPYAVFLMADFGWDDDYSLSGLKSDSNETLEIDLVFYNYDGTAYTKYYYGDDTRGTYWETNQPRGYHDTDFEDGNNERNFSVGCSDANQFSPNTYYYWWGYGVKNSEGSMAKVAVQRGYRSPSTWYDSCWTVFSEENVIVVPFSSWWAPGSRTWTY